MEQSLRKYLAKIGAEGGKAGTGASKRRPTTFNSERAKAALRKRWAGHRQPKNT